MQVDESKAVSDTALSYTTESVILTALSDTKTEHELIVMFNIEAPFYEPEKERAPLDVIAVLDKSGSMRGKKLDNVKKTMNFMVDQLKECDHLCMVVYDSIVSVEFSFKAMTVENKKVAKTHIANVKEGSWTNLGEGLFTGIQQLSLKEEERKLNTKVISSVLLFTDGLANEGISKIEPLMEALKQKVAEQTLPFSVFTFGFGADHSPDMLKAIADNAKGIYYFIEKEDDIPSAFGDCMGGLLSVVAQNLKLTLQIPEQEKDKIQIIKILGTQYKFVQTDGGNDQSNRIEIPDIYSEEIKNILILLKIQREKKLQQIEKEEKEEKIPTITKRILCNATLEYFNVITNQPKSTSVSVPIYESNLSLSELKECTEMSQELKEIRDLGNAFELNQQIQLQRLRLQTVDTLERAKALVRQDQSNLTRARQMLTDMMDNIKKSAVHTDPLAGFLIDDLKDCLRDMNSYDEYQRYGEKKMMSKMGCHEQQRKVMYCNAYSNRAKTQSQAFYEQNSDSD